MEIIIQSGVARKELELWLEIVGVRDGVGRFIGPDWQVCLGPEVQIRSGSLVLPRTKVVFRGEDIPCIRMVAAFRLKFLSAGG